MGKRYKVKVYPYVIEVTASSTNEACSEALLAVVENPYQLETEVIEEPDDEIDEPESEESWFPSTNTNTVSIYQINRFQYAGFTHYETQYSYL
jgi:hypothetical protein